MATPAQLAMSSETGAVPPTQMVYSDLLSVSYPSKKTQIEFAPSNGSIYNPAQSNTIEIPLAIGTGSWIDLSNSYLKINVKNNGTGNAIGFKTPHDFIDRLQILGTNSEMIEDIQNYNSLARLLCVHQLGEDGWTYNNNLGEFQPSTLSSAVTLAGTSQANVEAGLSAITGATSEAGQGSHHGQINKSTIANNQSLTVCFPLISGLINCGKYLPLGMLKNRSLTLRIQLASGLKAFASSSATDPALEYSDVSFVADVISMSEVYNEKFRQMMQTVGDISIHYTTYKNYQDSKEAGTNLAINGLIPDSSRSLKSIFTVFNPQTLGQQDDNLRLVNPQLTSYQYTIQSDTYPQKDVINISKTNRNQAFANLHIALGQLGSLHSRCMGTADSFYPSDTKATCNNNSSSFALGVCAETHNKSSNLLESGINLSNSTQPCRIACVVSPQAPVNVLHYTLSDRLIIIDGSGNLRSSG